MLGLDSDEFLTISLHFRARISNMYIDEVHNLSPRIISKDSGNVNLCNRSFVSD
jgi:hypothetical protein